MISFESTGDFKKTEDALHKMMQGDIYRALDTGAKAGVAALASMTPVDGGQSAAAWSYEIVRNGNSVSIYWTNHEIVDGTPLVILLQHGHGTGTGGYVQGRNFINPAIKPIFDRIADDVWKAVKSA